MFFIYMFYLTLYRFVSTLEIILLIAVRSIVSLKFLVTTEKSKSSYICVNLSSIRSRLVIKIFKIDWCDHPLTTRDTIFPEKVYSQTAQTISRSHRKGGSGRLMHTTDIAVTILPSPSRSLVPPLIVERNGFSIAINNATRLRDSFIRARARVRERVLVETRHATKSAKKTSLDKSERAGKRSESSERN